ncbi:MAG: YggS family pyridoxal phosphate-dependent enzyme [Brevinematia bacterium]
MKPSENYKNLLEDIEKIKSSYGIKYEIEIVVVSKYASIEEVESLLNDCKVKHLGENRVQEAEKKFSYLESKGLLKNISKHMLGPVQSNKISKVAKLFDFVHSIENLEVPEGLIKRGYLGELLIEVKTSHEATKHGIEVEKTLEFFGLLKEKGINISGLMTMAPFTSDVNAISRCFSTLRRLKEEIENNYKTTLKYLSMGMSNDYHIAIKEGSNLLRIGSSIFRK